MTPETLVEALSAWREKLGEESVSISTKHASELTPSQLEVLVDAGGFVISRFEEIARMVSNLNLVDSLRAAAVEREQKLQGARADREAALDTIRQIRKITDRYEAALNPPSQRPETRKFT